MSRIRAHLVDTTTLIVTSTVVQTVVISITLIVFVLQFRSQERAVKEASYQGLIGRYNDLVMSLADKPDLALALFVAAGMPGEAYRDATREDAQLFSHLPLAYGIIEEAYLMYAKKWISEDDWMQWSAFLERLSRHPLFPVVHTMSSGTFDKRFEDYVSTKIPSKNRTTAGTDKNAATGS